MGNLHEYSATDIDGDLAAFADLKDRVVLIVNVASDTAMWGAPRLLHYVASKGAVISMGVYIGQSTRIYDREKDEVIYGRVPAGAVVVPGSLPSSKGNCSLYAAIIVKRVDEKTRAKTGINELLRED